MVKKFDMFSRLTHCMSVTGRRTYGQIQNGHSSTAMHRAITP